MTGLAAILKNSQQAATGKSEKLLELYWNRAELKKEFASLRNEAFRLKQALKAQEGDAARVQRSLDTLESLLLDPERVHSVVAFYQLRALNHRCKDRVAQFAEQLKQQREKKEYGRLLGAWDTARQREARSITVTIDQLESRLQKFEDALHSERQQFLTAVWFLRLFRRRSHARAVQCIETEIASLRDEQDAARESLAELAARQVPDTEGLGIASKRTINFMILSFAQQLYLHFLDDDLVGLAKASEEDRVGAMHYGDHADCGRLLDAITHQVSTMDEISMETGRLQLRAKLIRDAARFRSEDDAVPDYDSVAVVYDVTDTRLVGTTEVNLLAEDYWDLARVLSR